MAKKKTPKKRRMTKKPVKKPAKKVAKKVAKRGGPKGPRLVTVLRDASVAQLEQGLAHRLVVRQKELQTELDEINAKLKAFGLKRAPRAKAAPARVRAAAPGRKRARRGSMPDAVKAALKGKHLSVDDLIGKLGHLTTSTNKRAILSQAIMALMNRGEIKRIKRGIYTS
ncbi:MAG: hypothetical protein KAS72_02565 [Phycisphaerales bacterium]|nr:hypothetical protein [Phycisphaerales bacterium]